MDPTYFPAGPEEAIARANAAGVGGFVVIGVGKDLSQARAAVRLAEKSPATMAAAVGIHPHDATSLDDATFAELRELGARKDVVAIGEIGLDYHYDHSPRDVQRETFRRLVGLAGELKKPIVIHTREAADDTIDILRNENARDVGGVIHCFSEDRAFAEKALDLGFYVSFSGIVTFKKTTAIQDVAQWAPADRILVETDSPYLAPIPMRGKPCEPAYVVHTAKRVAELRGIPFEALVEATAENTERLFRRSFGA